MINFPNLINQYKGIVFLSLAIALYFLDTSNNVKAQVIEDNTLSTKVNTENNRDFTVNAGERRGNNLFHSFREFSIPNNGSVLFDNAVTIENIISRVTGSSASNIRGLIQSNGTANLFLLNPNGIIFGENARLNIGGSFIGTTAESLVFGDGSQFSSIQESSEPLLTVSVPLGLQFGNNPGEIINQANFSIPNPLDPNGQSEIKLGLTTTPGKTLALLGGKITFDGGAVNAASGNIELGSVAANSFVTLEPIAQGWNVNYQNVRQFQDLVLDNVASIDASGEGGGGINIYGKNIQVLNGSSISSTTFGAIDGKDILINASELLEINGSDQTNQNLDLLSASAGIFVPISSSIISSTLGEGSGSDIKINAGKLEILDGAKLQTQTIATTGNPEQKSGNSGDINIESRSSIVVDGFKPLLGVAENVEELFPIPLEAQEVLDLERIIDLITISSIDTLLVGGGSSGNINISSNTLRLQNGGSITNSPSFPSSGDGGEIIINAQESIEILGSTSPGSQLVGIISANTFGLGDAGNINLATEKLLLQAGGGITTGTLGTANGGDIVLNAKKIDIRGTSGDGTLRSGFGSETFGIGNAGDLIVNTEKLTIANQGQITVRGLSTGLPGNLTINANSIKLNNDARIIAENAAAIDGGNIQLNLEDNLTLKNNSRISAQAFGNANGGNVDIDAEFVIAFPNQNNDILANAVAGNGGNINLAAEGVFGIEERKSNPPNLTNDIDASSEFGEQGTVTLGFPQFTDLQRLFNLDPDFVDVNHLLNNNFCNISRDSKYIITGRGGIPLAPEDDFITDHAWSDWRIVEQPAEEFSERKEVGEIKEESEIKQIKQIEMIQGWVTDRQGRIMLTANPLQATPHKSGLNTLNCNQVRVNKK